MPDTSDQRTTRASHVTLAVVLQVRDGALCVLLWQRRAEPVRGRLVAARRLPRAGATLEQSIRRHLARKVDVAELSWLEQLETLSDPGPPPRQWQLATTYLGLVPLGLEPALPPDTAWHPVDRLPGGSPSTTGRSCPSGRERLRAKLSYTNIGFALAPERFTLSELRGIYEAVLGYAVDPTNLRRVLERRGLIEATGERRASGREGGRPAAVYRFTSRSCEVAVRSRCSALPASRSRLTSSAGAEWVSAPTLMKSTPVSATARTVSRVIPPLASSSARPPASADRPRAARRASCCRAAGAARRRRAPPRPPRASRTRPRPRARRRPPPSPAVPPARRRPPAPRGSP